MENFKLQRTGDLPLSFEGELLNQSGGKWFAGRDQNRWHDLAIYKTKAGTLLLHIEYVTQWQGESDHSRVENCGTEMSAVIATLKDYNPVAHLGGYPPGRQFEERQTRLCEDLTRRFRHQITELFAEIGEAIEKID